jgi:hypothetical protein
MIEKGLARNVLTNVFPEECRAVGPNSLNDLLSQDVTIVAPDEGRPFPIMEIFEFPKGSGSIHSCCLFDMQNSQGSVRSETNAARI